MNANRKTYEEEMEQLSKRNKKLKEVSFRESKTEEELLKSIRRIEQHNRILGWRNRQ